MKDKDIVKEFVQRRVFYRKISMFTTFGVIIPVLLIDRIIPNSVMQYSSSKIYILIVVSWAVLNYLLANYIGVKLSICPICFTPIKTLPPNRRSRFWRFGNGPLPDRCPHCGTDFSKYDSYRY